MDTVGSIDIIDGSQYEVYTNSTMLILYMNRRQKN